VAEHLPTVWVAVRAALRTVLDGTSLADVLSGDLPEDTARLAADREAWRSR
jgi:DNA-binding IscR family transcriptional regulator